MSGLPKNLHEVLNMIYELTVIFECTILFLSLSSSLYSLNIVLLTLSQEVMEE